MRQVVLVGRYYQNNTMRKDTCFVMMPFGEHFEEYYKKIYLPAIEKCNLIPKRADSIYRPSPILHDIWSFINESKLVIADITGRNPNVMYELGLAHAVAKPAIIISNDINDVPFDLKSLRILLYDTIKADWSSELSISLEKSINEILESPVNAVLPTFLTVKPSKMEEVSEIKRDLIEIKQYLYRVDLDTKELDNKYPSRVLNSEEYSNAIKDAYRLYFNDGLDLTQIKDYLRSKYKMGIHTASDIIDTAKSQ